MTPLSGFWSGGFVCFLSNWEVVYTKRLFLSLIKKYWLPKKSQVVSYHLRKSSEHSGAQWIQILQFLPISFICCGDSACNPGWWQGDSQALVPWLSIPRSRCCSHLGCMSWSPSRGSEITKNSCQVSSRWGAGDRTNTWTWGLQNNVKHRFFFYITCPPLQILIEAKLWNVP